MKVVVDTSVWSLAFRRKQLSRAPEARALKELISSGQTILVLGIILQEILQGIGSAEQFKKLKSFFSAFSLLELNRDTYEYAAELFNACRRKGIQSATVDCLIASATIQNDCYLFTTDKDFLAIAKHCPLRLFPLHE